MAEASAVLCSPPKAIFLEKHNVNVFVSLRVLVGKKIIVWDCVLTERAIITGRVLRHPVVAHTCLKLRPV